MRRWLANAGLFALASLVALAVAELSLRIAGFSYPNFFQPDPVTGVSLIPGEEGWQRHEGKAFIRINSEGLRDGEHEKAKPAGALRIAVLGDSYAEALQVPQEQTFWSVLERELAGCQSLAGRRIETINFGVSGSGTAQQLLRLRHRVWDYEPDVVLLAFLTGNDFRDNVRELAQTEALPYFVLRDGKLVLDDAFLTSPSYRKRQSWTHRLKARLTLRIRTAQLLYLAKDTLARRELVEKQEDSDWRIYRPPADSRWQQAWEVTEALIEAIRDDVAARGARFQLVTLTNPIQVHPDPAVRAAYAQRHEIEDPLLYPDERIATFARERGIPVLTLAQPFRSVAEATGTCLHGFANALPCDGHWNATGHRLAGELMAGELCRRLTP